MLHEGATTNLVQHGDGEEGEWRRVLINAPQSNRVATGKHVAGEEGLEAVIRAVVVRHQVAGDEPRLAPQHVQRVGFPNEPDEGGAVLTDALHFVPVVLFGRHATEEVGVGVEELEGAVRAVLLAQDEPTPIVCVAH